MHIVNCAHALKWLMQPCTFFCRHEIKIRKKENTEVKDNLRKVNLKDPCFLNASSLRAEHIRGKFRFRVETLLDCGMYRVQCIPYIPSVIHLQILCHPQHCLSQSYPDSFVNFLRRLAVWRVHPSQAGQQKRKDSHFFVVKARHFNSQFGTEWDRGLITFKGGGGHLRSLE
jgi:hypothetical protein